MADTEIYQNYFDRYTSLVEETSITDALNNQDAALENFFSKISEEKSDYAYAEGKWTLKEMLQHMIDTERIFTYRALAVARKETANLPGFDENLYADNSDAGRRSWADLAEEMRVVRKSTKILYSSFSDEMMEMEGTANNNKCKVSTIGFIIPGHVIHHLRVAEERYL
jgi:hypothetical protein